MTITSTEFQQNVGHYLELLENENNIIIQRLKPKKASFIIKKQKQKAQEIGKNKKEELMKKLDEFIIYESNSKETGLQLQKRVRS